MTALRMHVPDKYTPYFAEKSNCAGEVDHKENNIARRSRGKAMYSCALFVKKHHKGGDGDDH